MNYRSSLQQLEIYELREKNSRRLSELEDRQCQLMVL